MSFTFNADVPAANNNPSVDQPDMLQNNISTNGILAVDHIGFNALAGGTHLKLTMTTSPNYIPAPAAPVGNNSIIYTQAGVANGAASLLFQNSLATLRLSCIRAMAYVDGTSGGIISSQSFNVATVTRNSTGNYSIALTTNAVSTDKFFVLATSTRRSGGTTGLTASYEITGIGTFDLFTQSGTTPFDATSFGFIVIQI